MFGSAPCHLSASTPAVGGRSYSPTPSEDDDRSSHNSAAFRSRSEEDTEESDQDHQQQDDDNDHLEKLLNEAMDTAAGGGSSRDGDGAYADALRRSTNASALPPLFSQLQLPSFASFAASSSLPLAGSFPASSLSSSVPSPGVTTDLSALFYPLAAAAAAAAASAPPPVPPPMVPSSSSTPSIPARLFASEAVATAALLLINENLSELD
jgi:hypothetical protein